MTISKTQAWMLSLAALVIAGSQGLTAYQSMRQHAAPELVTAYHAISLLNGQVYFGRIEALGTDYTVLRDVFYIQSRVVNAETKEVANTMIKRGGEWHGPDRMIINRQQIMVIEPVKPESQIAKLIAEQSKADK
ncbi:hypothetical protein [Roseateles oligotrophus]|uniref:Uncharacterized protein n=1 Tax=Roseateles oligotrophus TaxID=1769250 RepID=A0ABT2YCI5_9BURK|nr:hypothetical protein [Roseateles oligotrophus]MCV2367741.1 hypothetical protein [Roseateles oligotrophus]